MNWQFSLAAQEANHIPGCIKSSVASGVTEGIPPIYSTLMRSHLEHCISSAVPNIRSTQTCWSESRMGHKDDQRVAASLL